VSLSHGGVHNLLRTTFRSLLAAVTLMLAGACCAQTAPQVADNKVIGAGFTVTIPPGFIALPAATAETAHGFYIDLNPADHNLTARSPKLSPRFIAFDTKWDDGDMPSLDAAVQNVLMNLSVYVPADVRSSDDATLDGNLPARLGGLPARRLIIKFRNSSRKPAVRQILVAYKARKEATAIVYFLILNTTEQDFNDDVVIFSKLLAGFTVTNE
jgi:hypothetical protein